MATAQLETAAQTIPGGRPTNQDRMFAQVGRAGGDPCGLFCVADGMGGLGEGHLAAEIAAAEMADWWERHWPAIAESVAAASRPYAEAYMRAEFQRLFLFINEKIRGHAAEWKSVSGTTCSALLLAGDAYHVAHAGDSRVFMIKRGLFRYTGLQLTQDHNWAAEQLRAGVLSPQDIFISPKKNMLTSCLGVFENPQLYTASGKWEKKSTFLLYSDGLYRAVDERALIKTAAKQKDMHGLADKLIRLADAQGARDNVTVVAVRVR